MRLDLDGRLESLEGGLIVSLGGFNGTEPDQGPDIIRIEWQRSTKARFRLIQPALEHQDLAQSLVDFGGTGDLGGQLQQLHFRLFQIPPIEGCLGTLADLLGTGCLFGGWRIVRVDPCAPAQLHPTVAASRLKDMHLTAIEAPPRMASRPLPWGGLIVSPGPGPPCDPLFQTG